MYLYKWDETTRTPKIQLILISASHLLVHFISVTATQKYDVEFPDSILWRR